MDKTILSYSIFYLSIVTEKKNVKKFYNSFSFLCLPLSFHPGSFSQLRNFTNSSHTCRGWGSREGPAKTILQLESEGEMTFVYILLLRSKNIFQALKQLEEGAYQAFYNSVLLVSGFCLFVCFPIHAQYIQEHLLVHVGDRVNHCRLKWTTVCADSIIISSLPHYACTLIT